jgi:hypothetical protein
MRNRSLEIFVQSLSDRFSLNECSLISGENGIDFSNLFSNANTPYFHFFSWNLVSFSSFLHQLYVTQLGDNTLTYDVSNCELVSQFSSPKSLLSSGKSVDPSDIIPAIFPSMKIFPILDSSSQTIMYHYSFLNLESEASRKIS